MNSRQRVRNFFEREKLDRVPIDYSANPEINQKLLNHFKVSSALELKKILNVDILGVNPNYIGKRLHLKKEGLLVYPDLGITKRWIKNEYGGYWDCCEFPLEFADEEEVANYPLPTADDYDYDGAVESAKELSKDFGLFVGGEGMACWINTNGFLRGMEQTFIDLAIEEPAGLLLAKRRFELELARIERFLDKASKYLEFMWIGEDLGTQHTPIISVDTYRKIIKPWHKKYVDLAKSYNLPVMMHTCGSSSWVYEDLIDIGVRAVQTLQPEAANMSPKYLKEHFGGRLCFHGCISTAGPVAYGTPEEVEQNIKETLDIMMPGYEYAFAPTHQLQDNSPLENVLKMYECAIKYGTY